MTKLMNKTSKFITAIVLFYGVALTGCGSGGATSSSQSTVDPPQVAKTLSWAPPNVYQDNSPLDANRDLVGYNIYIKSVSSDFSENDVECATASPSDTSMNLVPLCSLLGLPSGTYRVSIRAVANNGLLSEFSPSATFTF